MTQNYNVFIGRLVENKGGNCKQRIEPAASLVNRLGNKVRRELRFKQLLVFKGIMVLRKRH